jgi:O-antigen biosynthesis protein
MRTVRDLLLGPLYWFRRSFLLRTRRYPLRPEDEGWSEVDDAHASLPHGNVRLRLIGPADWASLELRGRGGRDEPRGGWRLWFERPAPPGELSLFLPHGLRRLALRLSPVEAQAALEAVELSEVGFLEQRAPAARDQGVVDPEAPSGDYLRWLAAYESPSIASRRLLAERARASGLRGAVLLAADDPTGPRGAPASIPRVRAVDASDADFLVTVPPGATLAEHAVDALACAFAESPAAKVVHADEDTVGPGGRRLRPSFKPVASLERLMARSYLDGLVAFRRSALPAGAPPTLDRAGRLRLLLSVLRTEPASVSRLPAVLATVPRKPQDGAEERLVVSEHLRATGVDAVVAEGLRPWLRHVRYRLPDPAPSVSIIVPTRNAHLLVESCVRSVRRLTRYSRFEIILVDNGSDDPAALAAFSALAAEGLVHLVRDPAPFNYAALNNRAVRGCAGELLCLLNNDVEAQHPEWLEEMVGVALQPDIGAVGAKLLYPDGRIQHAGVLVGYFGGADHLYARAPGDASGVDEELLVRREVSAVTAACLVVRRDVWDRVGGLDEQKFPVGYNDVDFCLKLREIGLRNVWTPHARLVHHESATRGRTVTAEQLAQPIRETEALQERWHTDAYEDPFHSPNLSLDSLTPALAFPPRRRPWAIGCGS